MSIKPEFSFWKGKKVLITGHTGFKGSWLSLWLNSLGAKVYGIGLEPDSEPNLFTAAKVAENVDSSILDIRDAASVKEYVKKVNPEVIFHLAAQALVRPGYQDPVKTFAVNTQGTANVLDALRDLSSIKVAVIITTDKVYHNLENYYPYRETDRLGGYDPYSASKAAAEIVVSSFKDSFFNKQGVAVSTARAGNVIGGGDWSVDRLIPDTVRAWSTGKTLSIRRPESVRPWQFVLEPLSAYIVLAEKMWTNPEISGAYNFGPETNDASPVRKVISIAREIYGEGDIEWGDATEGPHEANLLMLEISKARSVLGIKPELDLEASIKITMDWYKKFIEGSDGYELCMKDIQYYQNL